MNINRIVNNCIVDSNGCWVWQKSCNSAGYGQLTENKVYWLAHRYVYVCLNTSIRTTDVIRHQCHNPKCCNPDHLLLGTHQDNWHDSEELHREKASLRRSQWSIQGVEYETAKEAQQRTGISMGALIKHTINGVFQVDAYRDACKKSRHIPKI